MDTMYDDDNNPMDPIYSSDSKAKKSSTTASWLMLIGIFAIIVGIILMLVAGVIQGENDDNTAGFWVTLGIGIAAVALGFILFLIGLILRLR